MAAIGFEGEFTESVENIGAWWLHTVMVKLLENKPGAKVEIDAAHVRESVSELAKNADLSKFVL